MRGNELIDVVNRYQGQGVLNLLPMDGVIDELDSAVKMFDESRRRGRRRRPGLNPGRVTTAGGRACQARPMQRSPLDAEHRALGAKLVPFGGWEMPLAYGEGTVAEHRACRTGAVAFDVSHLGTVRVTGADAFDRLQPTFTNDLAPHRTRAGPVHPPARRPTTPPWSTTSSSGGVDAEVFDVMPNASNTDGVRSAIGGDDVTADPGGASPSRVPRPARRLAAVSADAAEVGRFHVRRLRVGGPPPAPWRAPATRARTAWSAPCPPRSRRAFWRARAGRRASSRPGSARATRSASRPACRCTATSSGRGITPLQAGLGWVVRWDTEFRGKEALAAERDAGVARRLRGLVCEGRRPPRTGSPVSVGGVVAGEVTSGNFSPMLETGIALAFLPPEVEDGVEVEIDVRGAVVPAVVTKPPFWPR